MNIPLNTKALLTVFASLLFLASCSENETIPEDLAGKKAYLKTLKAEMKTLEKSIADVHSEILVLEPPKELPKTLVTTLEVTKNDFKRYVDIQANVTSSDAVMASPELGGRLTSMTVDEGDYVKRGQVIATLDMEAVNKQVSEIEKSLELAVDIFNRQDRLWKQDIGSEVQYLQAKNNKERLEKSLETVKFQLTKSTVASPISGYVDVVFAKQGEVAGPGAPIVQIINTSTVKVVADIPENYLGSIKKGQLVGLTFPALELQREGKVSLLGRSIDPANRTFKVEVDLRNSNGVLKPNLLSIMKLNDLTVEGAVTAPLELVQQEVSGKDYLYIVSKNDGNLISEKKYVKTGPSYGSVIVIEEGLNEGDQLIVTGARGLANGELLTIQN